ncbi:chromosome segregation protein SMC [Endomicrobium proavitum]|uniref:Chromosome partition protein Smc n=1 Tax=Endomicrobium proavitum TaxID=1408281 RepID=A0A0G3WH85_9BACT|nr:chromosome segregation protein SMC [Endomicrobium proavitum]AKL97693.1 chromosome condensation and segregation SMC ATPase [Endomicrobium proavitum]
MYLKKVELCGFKSFADRITLNFEPGITAIIGPNGCGKSNISDAIRWCLGEQRAKSMRSSQMQEVIFGGTQTRATTGMAEASLTFDNSQNVLPIDYSEVTVTRRLFRSGESEYFINKTQCRLKDIKDMFLDTGIGYDGYSIIEQGKVDFLTTAKPEDRRELFEEAAGVAKYKVRREETLRRLEKIDADMGRLSDSLVIHKQQITALDIQAKKAKQYKKFQEELAKYEVAALVQQISYGNAELDRLKKDLDPKIKDFEENNTASAQIDAQIQDMRVTLDEKNEVYVRVNQELGEIKAQIGVCDQIIQHSQSRETEIRAEQERLLSELEINREKVAQYEQQLKTLNTDDGSLAVETENLEKAYKEAQSRYDEIKAKLSAAQTRETEIRIRISELESEKESQVNLKAELSETKIHLDAQSQSLERIIARLQSEIEPTNLEIANIEASLSQASNSIGSLQSKQEEISKSVSENELKLNALENTLSQDKESLASTQSRIETLKEFDQQDPIRSSIRAVLNLGAARGPISSLIDADPSKSELIAAALGEKLNYLVCETSDKAEKAISFLEENGLSRLSFIVSEKIPQAQSLQALGLPSGSTELIKYLNYSPSDENIIKYICSGSIVAGNKVYSNVIVSGGGKSSFEKPVLIEDQVKKLEENAIAIKNKIALAQAEIEKISDLNISLKLQKEALGFEVVKIKTQIESKTAQIEEKRNDIRNTVDEINKHKEEINSQSGELSSHNDKISAFDQKLAEIEEEENKLYEEIKNAQNTIISVRKEEEAAAPVMMDARSAWDKKATELENKQKGQQYILDNITNIKQQIEYAVNKTAQDEAKLSELLTTQETETVKIQQLYEQQAQKDGEIQLFLGDRENLQNEIDEKTASWHELRSRVDALKNEVDSMQVDLKNFEYQKNNLEARLVETYGKSYEEVKAEYDGVEVNHEEIAKIKRKMEALGPVNQAAQEEYETLEQRYNFLVTQQQDLLKAKDDLHEVIKKINASTVENFKKTFDVVRANFKELYRKLFGGGEADLMLTDENNLLESGVDIFAQPPGKKLQNISLYSGGEKALTAVALLFAFFMVKPSPFCILDEVDAPLDDANIGRYIAMIKEFSAKTQFMVVTHNKRTMEMADILYGVTMEEHGVSKIISVRMNKQENVNGEEEDTTR